MINQNNLIDNKDIRYEARRKLDGKWSSSVIMVFIYFLFTSGASFLLLELTDVDFASTILLFFVGGPLFYGLVKYFLHLVRDTSTKYGFLFDGFSDYIKNTGLYILFNLIVLLGIVLFIIPGFVFALKYQFIFYILNDEPEISISDALRKSAYLTNGNKMKLFLLQLSFIGWAILSVFTFGIGTLFLVAYINTSLAIYYEDIKTQVKAEKSTLNEIK